MACDLNSNNLSWLAKSSFREALLEQYFFENINNFFVKTNKIKQITESVINKK